MNLLVAVPCYDGKIGVEIVRALLHEQIVAQHAGIEYRAVFLPGCSLISMARNQIAQDFLDSDADKLVFVDADVSWEPGSIIKLASHNVDFVGGAYRLKSEPENYPVGWLPETKELWAQDGLLEAAAVPGGFMCLTKRVFERLKEAHPGKTYSHFGFTGHAFFEQPYRDGLLYGEDAFFCASWRELGEKVWLDPELSLTHHNGFTPYPGHIGNWLKSRIPAQQEAA